MILEAHKNSILSTPNTQTCELIQHEEGVQVPQLCPEDHHNKQGTQKGNNY